MEIFSVLAWIKSCRMWAFFITLGQRFSAASTMASSNTCNGAGGPGEDAAQEAPPQNPPEGVRGAEPWENGDTTGSWGATNGSELLPGAVWLWDGHWPRVTTLTHLADPPKLHAAVWLAVFNTDIHGAIYQDIVQAFMYQLTTPGCSPCSWKIKSQGSLENIPDLNSYVILQITETPNQGEPFNSSSKM